MLAENIKSNTKLPEGDKRIVYDIPQQNPVESTDEPVYESLVSAERPDILTPAPIENPLAKPYAPSKDESDETELTASPLEDKGNFYRRGTVIHKLLQYIGTTDESLRETAAWEFLQKHLPDFSRNELQNIVTEVLNLCSTYKDIFTENSRAEVPIIGEVDGKIVSAKIDRLIINKDKVTIVDFKTNRPAAKSLNDVPEIYINQLNTYKKLLQKIYPDKDVETYLLWTNTCNMMKV